MVTTSPRPRHPKAYTILESLTVLAILAIFFWVAFALYKNGGKPAKSTGQSPPASSAATAGKPGDVAPPAGDAVPPAGNAAPEE